MSIGCNYQNLLYQELLKIYKDDAPNLSLVKATENRVKVVDYKIFVEPYTTEVQIPSPCGQGQTISAQAELKKVIVVATIRYNTLLVVDDCIKEGLYDFEPSFITAYDLYAILPLDAPVPEELTIVPQFNFVTNRVEAANESEVDYYMFAVDGSVELNYV